MKRLFSNSLKSAIFLSVIAICATLVIQYTPQSHKKNPVGIIHDSERRLVEFRKEIISSLEKISNFKNEKEFNDYFLQNGNLTSGFSFYVLNKSVLQYWSDNEPSITDSMLAGISNEDFLHLPNGDFLAYTIEKNEKKVVGLILLKHSYEYQNKYLVNSFNPALGISDDYVISDVGDTLHLPGNQPAYLLKHDTSLNHPPSSIVVWLYFIIALLFLIAIYFFLRYFSGSFIRTVIFLFLISALRTLMIYFNIPENLYEHGIFSPTYYASSFYFDSLGDMLINAAFFLVLSISLYQNILNRKWNKPVLFFICIFAALAVHFLISGLVINSNISFELSGPADINLYSILAFFSISILLLCFLFLLAGIIKIISGKGITVRLVLIGVTICAVYTATALSFLNKEKEHETRKLIAQKARMGQDHVAEYLIREQLKKIAIDPAIHSIVNSGINVSEKLNSVLIHKYFSGYLSKFELNAQIFDIRSPADSEAGLEYYQNQAKKGIPINRSTLYFHNSESGGSYYLSILPLQENDQKHTLVFTLTARFLHSTKGFPELFISNNYQDNSPTEEYSVAKYSGQSLIYEYGNYVYPLTAREFPKSNDEFTFYDSNGYCHLLYKVNDTSFIIVSKSEGNLLGILTLFSWMFIFMSILSFIVFLLSGIIGIGPKWQWNLTRRVQVSVIFLVVLTFVLVGAGTVYNIKRKYTNDQNKIISDQANALWFMVSKNLISFPDNEIRDTALIYKQLENLVNNTNIDFNLYNGNGKLIYSSQPEIFDKGVISKRMNPGAYFRIKEKGLTQFIHPENAGLLNYISAYAPFTDASGNIIAFLNLPYFEKQNELNTEISAFLSAIVNIYVLLFSLAVFVTIFISSQITKPLLLIQEKMSGIKLGSANEKIKYLENDEIGQLVHEYNRMIEELSISAEKLARSERESAWREMARQVAHEIKNPLTPMKLSVQHLSRTFKDKGYGDDANVERITATLIQQIDTLSNIATAFSNFAMMPQPAPVKIDLRELLEQVVSLYNEGVDVDVHVDEKTYYVKADRDQLIGVFSNLMKNALQSMVENRRGKITISLRRELGFIVVKMTDNGIGIPEDQRDKIFTPNFTTKSSGMGLGLAFVRNIVEEASGKVWFTSFYGEGSSFYVSLPEAE